MLIVISKEAGAVLEAAGSEPEHIVEHHLDHQASGCGCLFGKDGQTALRWPPGDLVLIISESAGVYYITAPRGSSTPAPLEPRPDGQEEHDARSR